jgi:hypothetical protein
MHLGRLYIKKDTHFGPRWITAPFLVERLIFATVKSWIVTKGVYALEACVEKLKMSL